METFAKMFEMLWNWIEEDSSTLIHVWYTEPKNGTVVYNSGNFVGFYSGYMDFFRYIEP